MRQATDKTEQIKPFEIHRSPRGWPPATPCLPAIKTPEQSGEDQWQKHQGGRTVGNTAAKAEMFDTIEPEKTGRIHIRQVRADDQCGHGQTRLLLETCLTEQCPDQAVRQIIHRRSDQASRAFSRRRLTELTQS